MRRLRIITDGTGEGTRVYDDETGEMAASLVIIEPTLGLGDVPKRIIITNINFPDNRKEPKEPSFHDDDAEKHQDRGRV